MSLRKRPSWHFFLLFVRQYYREPATLFWSFGFPLLAALLIAPAMSNDTKTRFRVGIDPAAVSHAQLVQNLEHDPLVIPVPLRRSVNLENRGELASIFMQGGLDALVTDRGLYVPEAGNGGQLMERLLLTSGESSREGALKAIRVALPGVRFIDWFVPGLLGLGLLSNGLFFVSTRIVLERSTGFFKRLRLSPFKRRSYLIGFASAYSLLCLMQAVLLTLAFFLSSGFRVQGNLAEFILWGTMGGVVFGLLGLAIAARIKTVQVASGISNLFYFPMMFLCGVYFKTEYFPDAMQPLIKLLPLTALNSGLRAIANGGTPLIALTHEATVLTCWALASLLFMLRFFNWGKE
jgi:ABC-type multidrug transport system permease subunit